MRRHTVGETAVLRNAVVLGKLTDVTVKDGRITGVDRAKNTDYDGREIDLCGKILRPGLVEIHAHGNSGFDTMDGTAEAFDTMSRFEFKHGVTSWLPTTMTEPLEKIRKATSVLPRDEAGKARILGFHMEGPFISALHKGAQQKENIISPSVAVFSSFSGIKMLTLAPELPGSGELIRFASENGVIVSLGHTDCDYDTARKAFLDGALCLTHTFNAMPPFLHREPGPIGAAITENAYVQVICDGLHLHRAAVLALYRIFGAERMVLISDSMRAAGLGDGDYIFGGQRVKVRNSEARTETGALAGSTATLFDCVKTAVSFGIPAEDAFRMASETPAKLLGVKKGRIAPGYDAEFIVTDEENKLLDTLIF